MGHSGLTERPNAARGTWVPRGGPRRKVRLGQRRDNSVWATSAPGLRAGEPVWTTLGAVRLVVGLPMLSGNLRPSSVLRTPDISWAGYAQK